MVIRTEGVLEGVIGAAIFAALSWVGIYLFKFTKTFLARQRQADLSAAERVAFDTQRLILLGQTLSLFVLLCITATLGFIVLAWQSTSPSISAWRYLPLIGIGYGLWACIRGIRIFVAAADRYLDPTGQTSFVPDATSKN